MGNAPFDWLNPSLPAAPTHETIEADMKAAEAALAAQYERQMETARLIHDVCAKGRGPEFMDWLQSRTQGVSLLNVDQALGIDRLQMTLSPADWAYFRSGQNSVYEALQGFIDLAESPPPATEGKDNGEE